MFVFIHSYRDLMNFKTFNDYVEDLVANQIPPSLLANLNGGIKTYKHLEKDDEEKNYYILGEYIEDNLGAYINLYYGSFKHFYGDLSDEKFKKKILSTIKHELTHHIESLTGHEPLGDTEDMEVEARLAKKEKKKQEIKKPR